MSEINITEEESKKSLNFIEAAVEKDLAEGKKRRTCTDALPARAERLPAHRARQSDLPGLSALQSSMGARANPALRRYPIR